MRSQIYLKSILIFLAQPKFLYYTHTHTTYTHYTVLQPLSSARTWNCQWRADCKSVMPRFIQVTLMILNITLLGSKWEAKMHNTSDSKRTLNSSFQDKASSLGNEAKRFIGSDYLYWKVMDPLVLSIQTLTQGSSTWELPIFSTYCCSVDSLEI